MAKYGDNNKYKLSRYERETTIIYNDEDSFGTVYTCNTTMIRKMDKLALEHPESISVKYEDEVSKTYNVQKKLIGIRAPRVYSAEDRLKMQERGRQLLL